MVDESEARQAAVRARRLRRMTRRSSQLTVGSVVPGRVHTIKGDMMMVNLGGLLGAGRLDPRLQVGQSNMVEILDKFIDPTGVPIILLKWRE
jgi:hypothetical protein